MREHAGRRHRKRAPVHGLVQSDVLDHGDRLAADHRAHRVEALRDEHALLHPQQRAGRRIHGYRSCCEYAFRLATVERPNVHVLLHLLVRSHLKRGNGAHRGETAESDGSPWPDGSCVTGTGVPPVAITRSRTPKPSGANTMTSSWFHVPPRPVGRVRQSVQDAASQIDPLQLAVGKKPNRAAIRLPERIAGSLGARERPRCHLIERPHPEPRRAVGRRDERQLPAVGRQRERYRIARRRRGDLKARRKRLGYSAPEVTCGGNCQRRSDDERQRRNASMRGAHCAVRAAAWRRPSAGSSVAPLMSSSI